MEPYPTTQKDDLIAKICKKDLRLSYSTLKSFTSPVNLINSKLKPFSKSPSMVFGSLCDILLLTPDRFGENFKIISHVPTSENQVSLSNALISIGKKTKLTDEIISIEFSKCYKTGSAEKIYPIIQDYVEASISGLDLITQQTYDEAKEICDNLMLNHDIDLLFSQIQDVQVKVEWKDKGWDFVGYLDMLLPDHIIDLKFSKDANPEKFERDIANFDYFLQAAMYCKAVKEMGICSDPKYSFIVYDKSMNYSIIELDYTYLKYGERKYNFLLQELDRCIADGAFDESYGFFKRSYKVYKPKWAKAFLLDDDEED